MQGLMPLPLLAGVIVNVPIVTHGLNAWPCSKDAENLRNEDRFIRFFETCGILLIELFPVEKQGRSWRNLTILSAA